MRLIKAFILMAPMVVLAGAMPAYAQDLVGEALKSFPAGTVRIEYSRPATLRKLPDYDNLRQRYAGPRLKKLESSLSRLGVQADSVDELVLGWSADGGEAGFYGLASGHFDSRSVSAHAAAEGIAPDSIGGKTAYCLGAGLDTPCVVILGQSEGAFGTLSSLTEIMDVRSGAHPGLESNADFTKAVKGARTGAAIWGVAVGKAVAGWFKGWMPSQQSIQLDWAKVFQNVNALAYSVTPADSVHLDLKLFCQSSDAAASLRQVMEGLKLAQQLAWQTQNPNRSNPFQDMEVAQSEDQIRVQLSASYNELNLAGAAEPANP